MEEPGSIRPAVAVRQIRASTRPRQTAPDPRVEVTPAHKRALIVRQQTSFSRDGDFR